VICCYFGSKRVLYPILP